MKKIKLMADYQCYPLWDISTGSCGDIDPNTLPISNILKRQLNEWSDIFDSTLNIDEPKKSGFKTEEEEKKFKEKGYYLFKALQNELGGEYEILFHNN